MAKTNEAGKETAKDASKAVQVKEVTVEGTGEIVSAKELAAMMKKKQQGMEVTAEYYEFPEDKQVRICYVGDLTIKGQNGEDVPAVRVFLEDETVAITASAVIVSTVKQYPKGSMFVVKRTGERRSNSGRGSYYTYEIHELN